MIVIAGYGYVGKAYYEVFKNYYQLEIVDPAYNTKKIKDIEDLKAVICCAGTPEDHNGACDGTYIFQVLADTPDDIPVLIKSTISIDIWQQIIEKYPNRKIAFSPEFLRAVSSTEDLANSSMFIVSGSGVDFWRKFFKKRFSKAKIHLYSVEEAILIKYFRNSYLATKVSFFNQVYDLCETYNIDFDCVRQGVCDDTRIGHSHSFVDAETARGWNGLCFPKDTAALLTMAKQKKANLSILKEAVEYNKKIKLDNN
jgi:UDPglucose 6-dehydrogenase